MFHHFKHGMVEKVHPVLKLECLTSGISLLPDTITINGQTETATFRYEGQNADATDWNATIGDDLTAEGSGGSFNQTSPFLDGTVGVALEKTRGYQNNSASGGDFGTDDFVIEIVCQFYGNDGTFRQLFGTNPDALGTGARISIGSHASNANGLIQITDGTTTRNAGFPSFTDGYWYHLIVFGDRSGSMIGYRNGQQAAATTINTIGTMDDLGLGIAPQANKFEGIIVLAQAWHADAWLDTHLQTAVAANRFNQLCGLLVSGAGDEDTGVSFAKNVDDIITTANGDFGVGARWPRVNEDGFYIDNINDVPLGSASLDSYSSVGSMSAEITMSGEDTGSDATVCMLHNNTVNHSVELRIDAGSDALEGQILTGGADQGTVTGTTDLSDGSTHIVAQSFDADDHRLYVDGVEEGTRDTTVTSPTVTRLNIGADESSSAQLNGFLKWFRYYRDRPYKRQ